MSLSFVIGKGFTSLALCGLRGTLGCQRLRSFTNLATMMYSHRIHLLLLTLRRTGVATVAVCRLDTSVDTMDNKFGALVPTNLSAGVNGLCFGGVVTAGALSTAAFDIPATLGIVNDVMRRTRHIDYPL